MNIKLKLSSIIIYSSILLTQIFVNSEIKVKAFDIKKAEEYYRQGDYSSTIESLQNVIQESQQKGDLILHSQSLTNLALVYLQQQNFFLASETVNEALTLIKKIDAKDKNKLQLLNTALSIKAEIESEIATPEIAIKTWQKSSEIAYQRGDISQFIYAKIKETENLQELGLYGNALENLLNIQPKLAEYPPDLVTATAWQLLGETFGRLGEFNQGEEALNNALEISTKEQNNSLTANILIAQGNLQFLINKNQINQINNRIDNAEKFIENIDKLPNYDAQSLEKFIISSQSQINDYLQESNEYYQQAIAVNDNIETKIIANLAYLNLLTNYSQNNIPEQLINDIDNDLNLLSVSKYTVNHRLNYANNLLKLENNQYNSRILEQLKLAYQESENINYLRGKSNALGYLGKLYLSTNNLQDSKTLTEKALYLSQQIKALDLTYQWQWQLGKIARQKNQRQEAIIAYKSAVNSLQSLRNDLVSLNNDLEFDFRNNIEPLYRELVDILLTVNATQEEIKLARDTIDSLQVAELDNYFRDACLNIRKVNLTQVIDAETAIFYPIILPDRLEVIVAIGNNVLTRHTIPINQSEIETEIEVLVYNLAQKEELNTLQKSLNNLYTYLIKPVEEKIASSQVKNIVFISDGILRNIPISALYNGEKYLVENYNIAVAPSLQLLPPESFKNPQLNLLLSGLSEINQDNEVAQVFSDLPSVFTEVKTINNLIPESQILLNDQFTQNQLQNLIDNSQPSILHIATHGQFSSRKEDTFLLTWEGKIDINELEQLFSSYNEKKPLELLVLSACQTAVGDKRAVLGLAGISLKAGARTTIASLWAVFDESTKVLMSDFYGELNKPNLSKAEALRNAQTKMIQNPQYNHPSYWSAFILVGNWL